METINTLIYHFKGLAHFKFGFKNILCWLGFAFIGTVSLLSLTERLAHAGNLFIADKNQLDVRHFNESTGSFIGSFGTTAANVSSPQALAFHPVSENLFVLDRFPLNDYV